MHNNTGMYDQGEMGLSHFWFHTLKAKSIGVFSNAGAGPGNLVVTDYEVPLGCTGLKGFYGGVAEGKVPGFRSQGIPRFGPIWG